MRDYEESAIESSSDPGTTRVLHHPEIFEPIFGDNEIDFDDEWDDDQFPLDEKEAIEVGVLLDDPERITAEN